MRIIKVDSQNWSKEIKTIEIKTIENISKDICLNLNHIDGYIKHDKYKIYKDHKSIDGLKITFVFTLESTVSKSQTHIYTMYTDIENDFYTLEVNLKKDIKIFKLNDYKKIKSYILQNLECFKTSKNSNLIEKLGGN